MALLVRKIERAKWEQKQVCEGESPSADAITNCMKTRQNTLSVWYINNEEELTDAILAIVSKHERPDSIDIVYFDIEELNRKGLSLQETDGNTVYGSFAKRHRDIEQLDFWALGIFAEVVVEALKVNSCKKYTKSDVRSILLEGIQQSKVNQEELSPHMREKLNLG